MSRAPLLNEPPLLDVERALRMAEDASALARERFEVRDRRHARLVATVLGDAALMALETALDTGDPRVLAAALELAEETPYELDRWERAFVDVAEQLLPDVATIDNTVRECARSKSERLRASTATALGHRALRAFRGEGDETDEEARRIVVALTEDPAPRVRAAAREVLAGAAPPAWAGLFDRDPLAVRPAAEAARLRAPLDRAALALERGVRRELAAFAEAVEALPDELAGPLLDDWIRTPGALSRDHRPTEEEALALLARVERLTPGDDVPEDLLAALSSRRAAPSPAVDGLIERLLDRWLALDRDGARVQALVARATERRSDDAGGARIGAALARQPHAVAIGLRLARWMRPLDYREQMPAIELGNRILEHGWPPDADPAPLFELALGAPLARAADEPAPADDEADLTRSVLLQLALAPRPSLALVLDTLIDVLIGGCPGRWSVTAHFLCDRLVEVAHPRLRALAEAWLHDDEPWRATWALRHLIAGGHDPEHDPPPEAILAAAAAEPKLRPRMFVSAELRRGAAEPLLRAQLAGGALPPDEALELARSLTMYDRITLTDEEQDAVRVAREALAQRDPPDLDALSWAATLMPPDAADWTAEDHAFLERLIDAHGADVGVTVRVALTLEKSGPDAALAALCERLLPVCYADERAMVKKALAVCRGERKNIWKSR